MVTTDLAVRTATKEDQNRISNLIYFEPYVHRHLDWGTPMDWIGSSYCWVIEKNRRINAALACPPDPESIAWIRLFTAVSLSSMKESWDALWSKAADVLREDNVHAGLAIAMQEWIEPLMKDSGFAQINHLVMLERFQTPLPDHPRLEDGLVLREMIEADLPAVAKLDAEAFNPIWHNSIDALRKAFPQSMHASVIENAEGRIIGYQISTRNSIGAHLARLAVTPSMQGKGLGSALVCGLIDQLDQSGIRRLSVNTQSDNQSSLALYNKLGFERTIESYPVYCFNF